MMKKEPKTIFHIITDRYLEELSKSEKQDIDFLDYMYECIQNISYTYLIQNNIEVSSEFFYVKYPELFDDKQLSLINVFFEKGTNRFYSIEYGAIYNKLRGYIKENNLSERDHEVLAFFAIYMYIIIEKGSTFYLKSIPSRKCFQRT